MSKLCQECPKWIDGTYTASTKRFGGGGGCDESSPGNYYRDWREDKAGPPPSAKKEFAANMSWTCQGHRKDGGKGRWKDWGKEGGRHGKDFKAGNCWSLGDHMDCVIVCMLRAEANLRRSGGTAGTSTTGEASTREAV